MTRPIKYFVKDPSPWAMPLTVSAESPQAVLLSTPVIANQAGDVDAQNRLLADLRFGNSLEAIEYDHLKYLAERGAARLGYADLDEAIDAAIMKSRSLLLELQPEKVTGDRFKNILMASPSIAFGTPEGEPESSTVSLVQATCSECHTAKVPVRGEDGMVRMSIKPRYQQTRSGDHRGNFAFSFLREAVEAELLNEPPLVLSNTLRAYYAVAKQAKVESEGAWCAAHHCDVATLSESFALRRSTDDVAKYGFLFAIANFAGQKLRGFDGPTAEYLTTDDLVAQTAPVSTSQIKDHFGNLFDALLPNGQLANVPMVTGRMTSFGTLGGLGNGPQFFTHKYADYARETGFFMNSPLTSRALLTATSVQAPEIDNETFNPAVLSWAGFSTSEDVAAALPRWVNRNLNDESSVYFFRSHANETVAKEILPSFATESEAEEVFTAYNEACSSCHLPLALSPLSANTTDIWWGFAFVSASALVDQPYQARTRDYMSNAMNEITALHETNALPAVMASIEFLRPDVGIPAIVDASSTRRTAYGYLGRVFVGWPSAADFVNACGGRGPVGFAWYDDVLRFGESGVLATALSTETALIDNNESLYGSGKVTGEIPHPTFACGTPEANAKLIRAIEVLRHGAYNVNSRGMSYDLLSGARIMNESSVY